VMVKTRLATKFQVLGKPDSKGVPCSRPPKSVAREGQFKHEGRSEGRQDQMSHFGFTKSQLRSLPGSRKIGRRVKGGTTENDESAIGGTTRSGGVNITPKGNACCVEMPPHEARGQRLCRGPFPKSPETPVALQRGRHWEDLNGPDR